MKELDVNLKKDFCLLKADKKFRKQKSNTQNIDIYKILHNSNHLVPESRMHVTTNLESTCYVPSKVHKEKVKTKHELKLEQELKEYQTEVEVKFAHSEVNRSYVFPRKEKTAESNKMLQENIIVSIYDQPKERKYKENSKKREAKILIIKKSHSQEKAKPNGVFGKFLKNLLRPKLERINIKELISAEPKIAFNNIQKVRQTNKSVQSYLRKHLQPSSHKGDHLHSQVTESDSQNAKLVPTKTHEKIKKTHFRNHTMGSNDSRNIRNILYSTKVKKSSNDSKYYKSNSKVNERVIHPSDLLRDTAIYKPSVSRSTNKMRGTVKIKKRSKFNNTLSLFTMLHKTKHRRGIANSKSKQK